MNKKFIILCGFLPIFFSLSCNNKDTSVTGTLPGAHKTGPKQETSSAPGYTYGNHFSTRNSFWYESLLSTCRRCGTKRLIGDTYQRYYVTKPDPKRCRNWAREGYIQIEFEEKKLPTRATLSIWPKYTGSDRSVWEWGGAPFGLTVEARPINEDEGFQMLINPNDGLSGISSISVTSDYTNHVKDSQLYVVVAYGQGDSQTIITQNLQSLKKRTIGRNLIDCYTYTN